MSEVTQALLHEYFDYNGRDLIWRITRPYANPGCGAGTIAGGVNSIGYRRITLFNKQYLAHRLIWLYVHGKWPDGMLDHINRDKLDNRIENLREADMALNVRNRDAYPSKLGVKGVYPRGNKFRASIQVNGKQHHLGMFDTIPEAKAARKEAEARYW